MRRIPVTILGIMAVVLGIIASTFPTSQFVDMTPPAYAAQIDDVERLTGGGGGAIIRVVNTQEVTPGTTFNVPITIEGSQFDSVGLFVAFDPKRLRINDILPGTCTVPLHQESIDENGVFSFLLANSPQLTGGPNNNFVASNCTLAFVKITALRGGFHTLDLKRNLLAQLSYATYHGRLVPLDLHNGTVYVRPMPAPVEVVFVIRQMAYVHAQEAIEIPIQINSKDQSVNRIVTVVEFDRSVLNVIPHGTACGARLSVPNPNAIQFDIATDGPVDCQIDLMVRGWQRGVSNLSIGTTTVSELTGKTERFLDVQRDAPTTVVVGPVRLPTFELRGPVPAEWGMDPSYQTLVVTNPRPEEMRLLIKSATPSCGTNVTIYVSPFSEHTVYLRPCTYLTGWSWSGSIPNPTGYLIVR